MENLNVAHCGLYCGECSKFKKGNCSGCYSNDKATWCDIKKCCLDNGFSTCAECDIIPIGECKKFNNAFSKLISFTTGVDRIRCIERIKQIGTESFALEMARLQYKSLNKQ